jgi:hypothetical protein
MVAPGDGDARQHGVAGHVGGENAAHGDEAHRIGNACNDRQDRCACDGLDVNGYTTS